MAADFTSDLSIPEQSDVVEKFYDSHPEECANVELGAGPDDEFMNRISNAANGAEEGAWRTSCSSSARAADGLDAARG